MSKQCATLRLCTARQLRQANFGCPPLLIKSFVRGPGYMYIGLVMFSVKGESQGMCSETIRSSLLLNSRRVFVVSVVRFVLRVSE